MNSVFIYSNKFDTFSLGEYHPFKPYKATMVYELCYRYGLFDESWIKVLEPQPAPEEAMLEYHAREYVEILKGANTGSFDFTMLEYGLGTGDNPVFKGVYDFSLLVLGATLLGAELISSGQADVIFSPVGGLHHAGYAHAEGFCYVNDIVIAIKRLLASGYRKVLYVDIDAHHGNGVQDAFYDTDDVLFISFHQSGETLYPWKGFEDEMGAGKGLGYTVNMPLPEYTDDEAYVGTFREIYTPLANAFKPDCVVAQIGLDTLKRDPLTNLRLTNNGYCDVIREIRKSCPKTLALGGGGYSVPDVVRGWTLAWAELNGLKPFDPYEGLVSGVMLPQGQGFEELRDPTYHLAEKIKRDLDVYLRDKVAFIKDRIFPIHGIG
ncbi:MAG TPA: acetoin utilization protein AcuC [Deltaproteobacteria bacterium]|nr:acetoin utilization protein AcuC [Deltaproteobacteria bacterium]HOI07758.1 acetoin utilization protein AcuC [Deltaproteobacteria bacterium]